jgi:hypothetical protein
MRPNEVPCPEIPGLSALHRSFAIALSTEKFSSSGKARSLLKKARSPKKKREVIDEQFAIWRERSGDAIRKFLPQYVDLGLAYSNLVKSEIVDWAEEMAWIPLRGQCGVEKNSDLRPHRSHSVIWWLAVAIDGDFSVNVPGTPPWCAPEWLVMNPGETEQVVEDLSCGLSARFAGVLDGELEAARVKVAIARAPGKLVNRTGLARGGRKPSRDPKFVAFAGQLWRENQGANGRVSDEALSDIITKLDSSEFSNPASYLQKGTLKKLIDHNNRIKQFGNSRKTLKTWADIVNGPQSLQPGVRKLLSDCAGNIRKPVSG